MNNTNLNPEISSIVKALAYTENGGKPDLSHLRAGGSGESKSVLQFLPATWKEYSKSVSGQDNLPMTPENEAKVAYAKVSDWLNHGYTPEMIASTWNSGRPMAYEQNVKGVNSKGVSYDTPAYVKKFTNYLDEFRRKSSENPSPIEGGQVATNKKNAGLIAQKSPTPSSAPPFVLKRKTTQGLLAKSNEKNSRPS